MKALMLAAGMGNRLSGNDEAHHPKCLLRFGGRTLLERHIANLQTLGVDELVLVVGYRAHEIEAEVAALGAGGFVRFVTNPRYREGSVISMWAGREVLESASPVLFMDADVLYDADILRRLVEAPGATCFPFDTSFEDGDEPVKFCLNGAHPAEFRKAVPSAEYETVGEWIGFIRMEPDFASALARRTGDYVTGGRADQPYEEAIRDLLLSDLGEAVAALDIAGLPWIEIDFPEDVERARTMVLPHL